MKLFRMRPHEPKSTGDDRPARSLWRYIWLMSGRHQIAVCVIAAAVAALGIVPLELQRRLVDDAISKQDMPLLTVLAVIYLAVVLVHGAAKFILRIYEGWLSESAIRHNRRHLSRLYAEDRTGNGEGENGRAISIIGSEIEKLGGFVGDGLSQPVVNAGMLIFGIGYMLSVEPIIGLIGVLALIPQIALVPVIQKQINRLIEKRVEKMREISDALSGLHPGHDDNHKEPPDRIGSIHRGIGFLYDNRMWFFILKFGMKTLINLLNALAPLSVLIVGGYLAIRGETSVGIIVAFISGFDRMSSPMRELLSYYRMAAQASVQHRMIAKWMN